MKKMITMYVSLVACLMFAGVATAAPVVYNLTVTTPAGFGGTLTFDTDVAPSSTDGTTDTYTYPNGAIVAFSFFRDGSSELFDQTDDVFELVLTMATSDDTPKSLMIDVDDSGGDYIFAYPGLDFGTGAGFYEPGAVNVTGAALTPVTAPASTPGTLIVIKGRKRVADFTLTPVPSLVTVPRGSFGASTVSVTPVDGFSSFVTLSNSGVPSGVTPQFSPSITPTSASLSFDVSSSASTGTSVVTVTGTSGSLTRPTDITLTITAPAAGAPFSWPAYSPDLNYDFRTAYPDFEAPSQILDDCPEVVETIASDWWCFRYGPDKNSLVTSAAWNPMLERMNVEFEYFRDVMGWPPDKRAKRGYYSSIYLFGSGLCTDDASNTELGGWQSSIFYQGEHWPMVLLSYYPVWAFDPGFPNGDADYQQGAVVHEGVHSVLTDMPGCRNAGWFHEGGNNWLQLASAANKTGNFDSLGWLSAGAMVAPFMPIECYSGWLQDGSFGGPSAEGVNRYSGGTQLCTWRNLLGGTQYGECFPTFMGEIVAPGSVAWIWQYCRTRVLEGLASTDGGLGPAQTRRLIKEFRARQAMCDFGRWNLAYAALLANNWMTDIHAEYEPVWIQCDPWTATCYVATTDNAGTLTPEQRTLPAWSGANQIPLTVAPGATSVSVDFQPIGANMSCQLVYRATDNSVVYSYPVSTDTCNLNLDKPVKNNVVVAVICNTDYVYTGDAIRSAKYDYRLTLGTGISGTADIYRKWWSINTL
jgi:hypothetical protein